MGKVILIGAGPGDPELITVRGLNALRRADVVLYDALANPALLDEVRPDAECIYVGKRAGCHIMPQEEMNALLWSKAQEYGIVVRLKAGDPFILGRGVEEADYLYSRGVEVEVVPGVTSATASAVAAGISLTRRHVSSAFAVVTGRQAHDAKFEPHWAALAQLETVVILMGIGRAAEIAAALIAGGRSPQTSVALVADATLPTQRTLRTTLAELGAQAATFAEDAPVTIIVGEVTAEQYRVDALATVGAGHADHVNPADLI